MYLPGFLPVESFEKKSLKVVFHKEGQVDWKIPVYGQYGGKNGGMLQQPQLIGAVGGALLGVDHHETAPEEDEEIDTEERPQHGRLHEKLEDPNGASRPERRQQHGVFRAVAFLRCRDA